MQDILKRFFMYEQGNARWVLNRLSDEKAKRDSTFDLVRHYSVRRVALLKLL